MGNRRHNKIYPLWSAKNTHGPMPRWIKKFQHRLQRQADRDVLSRPFEDPLEMDPQNLMQALKGRTHWMWY